MLTQPTGLVVFSGVSDAYGEVYYIWEDEDGITHITDAPTSLPEKNKQIQIETTTSQSYEVGTKKWAIKEYERLKEECEENRRRREKIVKIGMETQTSFEEVEKVLKQKGLEDAHKPCEPPKYLLDIITKE